MYLGSVCYWVQLLASAPDLVFEKAHWTDAGYLDHYWSRCLAPMMDAMSMDLSWADLRVPLRVLLKDAMSLDSDSARQKVHW